MRAQEAATVEGDEKLRLFLAFTLPKHVEEALAAWGAEHLRGGRRVDAFHVTIAFLGSRPRSELPGIAGALRDACATASPFTLEPRRYRETRSVGMLVLHDPSGEAARIAVSVQKRLV